MGINSCSSHQGLAGLKPARLRWDWTALTGKQPRCWTPVKAKSSGRIARVYTVTGTKMARLHPEVAQPRPLRSAVPVLKRASPRSCEVKDAFGPRSNTVTVREKHSLTGNRVSTRRDTKTVSPLEQSKVGVFWIVPTDSRPVPRGENAGDWCDHPGYRSRCHSLLTPWEWREESPSCCITNFFPPLLRRRECRFVWAGTGSFVKSARPSGTAVFASRLCEHGHFPSYFTIFRVGIGNHRVQTFPAPWLPCVAPFPRALMDGPYR